MRNLRTPSNQWLPLAAALAVALLGVSRLALVHAESPAAGSKAGDSKAADSKSSDAAKSDNKPAEKPSDEAALSVDQARLADRYKELERVILRMAEVLQPTDPKRAALLKQAFAQSKERQIDVQFESLVKLLEKEQLYQANKGQLAVQQELNRLLQLLLSGERDKQIVSERAEIKKFIERVNKLIREQQGIQGETEGQGDPDDLVKRQGDTANKAGDLSRDLKKFDERDQPANSLDEKSGDNPDAKGDAKSADKGGKGDGKNRDDKSGKAGDKPDDKKGDGKEGDSKAGGKSGDKQSDQKSGQKSDGKNSDGKNSDGKSGKSGEKSDDKSGNQKDKSGQKSDNQKSDSQKSDNQKSDNQKSDGQKSDGQKSDGQKSDQNSDGKQSKGSNQKSQGGQQGNPQEGQPSDSQDNKQNQNSQNQDESPARKRIRQAEDRMREAKRQLEEANRRGASEEQEHALEELKQAKAELEEILRQLREEEIERVLAQLEGRFRKMLELQIEVYEGTVNLDKLADDQGDHDVEIESGKLSRKEGLISAEADKTLALLREEGSSVAFPETVEQMKEDMDQVTGRLSRANVGQLTQGVEQDIVKALEEMIAALQKAQKEQQMRRGGGGGGGGGGSQDQPLVNQIAELKMIRALQMRVNTRTGRYSKLLEEGSEQAQDPDLVEALQRLSEREQRIYRTTRDIVVGKNK